ncbi:MAG: sigma-70 family RNA polymerase sigma factor, partial [Eubacterium sp.]|nr:sigma-70 family RNA polymerase sigma factor [Eubacterium sp.]
MNSALDKTLHDAYVKALTSVNLLHNPAIFSSWLGIIIANISATELTEKNNANFKQVGEYANENWYENVLNDSSASVHLELPQNEIKAASDELINALSTEEKICVLHFYSEGFTIKEISKALRCSEEAVISFLNSGIKKLEPKCEELKKKNEKFAAFSNPIQLLIYLLAEEYNHLPNENVPDKFLNSIIEDTAEIAAKNFVDEETVEEEADDEEEEDEEEPKAGSGKKKAIIIIAILVVIIAAITIKFVNNGKEPSKPVGNTDKPSESETVSDTKPSDIEITSESTSESTSDNTTSSTSAVSNPVTNQTPNTSQQRPSQTQRPQNNNNNSNSNHNNNSNSGGSQSNRPTSNTNKPTQAPTQAPTKAPTKPATEPP